MRAVACNLETKKLEVVEVPKPVLDIRTDGSEGKSLGNVLVKVLYSATDSASSEIANGTYVAPYIRDMKTKPVLMGCHYAGVVEEIGKVAVGATDNDGIERRPLRVGDVVFGHLQYEPTQKQGAFAEYIVVKSDECARLSESSKISPKVAAAASMEGMTALQALVDVGRFKKGDSVLILGAGGSVGIMAVAIAKSLGATEVIGTCSTKDVERVRSAGADGVVDRKEHPDVLGYIGKELKRQFDVVFDITPACYSYWSARKLIKKDGAFVQAVPSIEYMLTGWMARLFFSHTFGMVECKSKTADLETVLGMLEGGGLKAEIDSEHPVRNANEALARQTDKAKIGRVVVRVDGGW